MSPTIDPISCRATANAMTRKLDDLGIDLDIGHGHRFRVDTLTETYNTRGGYSVHASGPLLTARGQLHARDRRDQWFDDLPDTRPGATLADLPPALRELLVGIEALAGALIRDTVRNVEIDLDAHRAAHRPAAVITGSQQLPRGGE